MTTTSVLGLTKDDLTDLYSVERVNANSDRIDEYAGGVNLALEGKQAALTAEQMAAVNSGVDDEAVAQISINTAAIEALTQQVAALKDSLYGLAEELGTESGVTVDLNDLKTPGRYRVFSTTEAARIVNAPFTDRGYELIVKYTSQANYIWQMCYPALNAPSANKFYIRHYRGSGSGSLTGWSAWYEYAGTALS